MSCVSVRSVLTIYPLSQRVGGLEPWLQDIYGCKGNLIAKRRKRNPYRRFHPYHTSCALLLFSPSLTPIPARMQPITADSGRRTLAAPELEGLFEYCPLDNEVYKGKLPWDGI